MASSVWSGYLTFGLISMPVRLFSGARGNHISFHMLHRDDNTRIKQQLWCPHDERVVERSEIVKGYEYRKGEYVIIEPEEIKKIEPKTAKAMEILEFVKADDVDPIYFESSYFVTPEEAGRRPYALLCKALEETKYVAIAKLTMHNREYTVFLRPYKGGMMLHTMYYKEEVRDLDNFGRSRCRVERRRGESGAPAHRGAGRRVRAGEISRHLRREPEDADQGAPGRRRGHAGREAEEAGAGRRPDGRAQGEPGADAEEAAATRRGCERASEVKAVAKGKKGSRRKPAA